MKSPSLQRTASFYSIKFSETSLSARCLGQIHEIPPFCGKGGLRQKVVVWAFWTTANEERCLSAMWFDEKFESFEVKPTSFFGEQWSNVVNSNNTHNNYQDDHHLRGTGIVSLLPQFRRFSRNCSFGVWDELEKKTSMAELCERASMFSSSKHDSLFTSQSFASELVLRKEVSGVNWSRGLPKCSLI